MSTKSEQVNAEIGVLLAARFSLLWIVSQEERRIESALIEIAAKRKFSVRFWDVANGCYELLSNPKGPPTRAQIVGAPGSANDPDAVLEAIRKDPKRNLYILKDFHKWLQSPITLRNLRNLTSEIQSCENAKARAIIILAPVGEVPVELQAAASLINYPLPGREEAATLLNESLSVLTPEQLSRVSSSLNQDAAVDAVLGMTAIEIENCYAASLVKNKSIDPVFLNQEKKRVVEREKVLSWFPPNPRGLAAIGGLDHLKTWLNARKAGFSAEARAYGLPAPKGVLLVGVPGSGKSLTAKCISAAWNIPLLRLDLGALKSKYVGESEGNIRKALQIAETVSPAVIWIDEIEKAMAGASGEQGDGGVSADALAVVLNWMQEKEGSAFVVATANDVRALPPELLRKGRFDEVFFVGLPNASERAQILRAAIRQYSRQEDQINFEYLIEATKGFTGAEIAALVPEAMFVAFGDNQREITTADLLTAAAQTVPLSRTSKEKIENLTNWARDNARSASKSEEETMNRNGRDLDFDN